MDSGVFHKRPDALPDPGVAVRGQNMGNTARLPKFLIRPALRDAQLQFHPEETAFSHLARHIDGPAHELHDIFRDRHAEPRALDLICRAVLRPGKRLKDRLQIFRRHPVPVVLHLDPDVLVRARALLKPNDPQPDMASLFRVFHRV